MGKIWHNAELPDEADSPGSVVLPGKKQPERMQVTAGVAPSRVSPPEQVGNHLPFIAYFAQEAGVRSLLSGAVAHQPIDILQALQLRLDQASVVVTGSEALLSEYRYGLERPNMRVIALSDEPFREPIDSLIYSYLPEKTPLPLIERMADNALDHIRLNNLCRVGDRRLAGVTKEIQELNRIGAALSAEHDTGTLLELILTKSREITSSDAGSLYLVETVEEPLAGHDGALAAHAYLDGNGILRKEGEELVRRMLRFKLAQNDSVSIPFREASMQISEQSIAGHVALTGKVVNLEDAYRLPPDVPYKINRQFDTDSGYLTRSILAVPLRNQKGVVVGVLQLINAKRDPVVRLGSAVEVADYVIPFSQHHIDIVESLASQAAVALENSQLYQDIQRLFEGFVKASVLAIEARDPTTSGHSFRVANLTVALAESVDRADSGPYAAIKFARSEMKEIRYASLLHDFGKVGVREEILVKAKKLYPMQIDLIRQRFAFAKQTLMKEHAEKKLAYLLERGDAAYRTALQKFDADLAQQIKHLDGQLDLIAKANEPTVLPEGNFEQLFEIAREQYRDLEGEDHPLLNPDEVRLLSIRKGSLDDAERSQIESHVLHTVKFLQQIPWISEIRNIPDIARGHHEKLNGRGYPYKLNAPEIPIQTRIMTISDIFDALCATDRPYKRAVSKDRALEILGYAVKDGEIDGQLFQLFVDAKVYERWKVEAYAY